LASGDASVTPQPTGIVSDAADSAFLQRVAQVGDRGFDEMEIGHALPSLRGPLTANLKPSGTAL